MTYIIKVELKNFNNGSEGVVERECYSFDDVLENIKSIRKCGLLDEFTIVKTTIESIQDK